MTFDRDRFLKTVGWGAVGIGLYLISISYDSQAAQPNKSEDDILDAEFTIINE